MVRVATPLVTVPVPRLVEPLKNVTVPVGSPVVGGMGVMVAVRVSGVVGASGFEEDVSAMVSFTTTSIRALDVTALKLASPEYEAVMLWLPTASVVLVNVVCPFVRVPVPRVVVPSRNVTVPVGVPVAGMTAATVAVNVTDVPSPAGLRDDVSVTVGVVWAIAGP